MDKTPKIARTRIRRLYYIGTALLFFLTLISFTVPTYFRIRAELTAKIEQLSESIIDQKKAFLVSTVVEKISDIERIRTQLENRIPSPDPEELDRRFRAAVRELIHTTELPDDGYIWINEILDYDGGDDYAIRFAHPNLIETEGDFLSTATKDTAGNLPYLEELEGIRADGEVFFDYYFQKMHSDVVSHKMSYAKLYEPYDWVVATGVYLDDVDELVRAESGKMRVSANRSLRDIGLAVLIATAVLMTMTVVFETRIQGLIGMYLEQLYAANGELRAEKSKLEDANRQKDRFFSIVAHDLSGPIGNLRILSDYLSNVVDRKEIDEQALRELSSTLGQTVGSMGMLIDDLLTWSRAQRNALEFNPAERPAADHAYAAIQVCAPIARSKGVSLESRMESSAVLNADANMVKTILRNLIGNAVKFTPSGGSVSVELSDDGTHALYRVKDTGIGMPAEKAESLFGPDGARSTPGTDSEKGTGLGLVLCREFVDRHGGTIEVNSVPGEGSEFIVSLPLE